MIPCSRKRSRMTPPRDDGTPSLDWASLDQDLVQLIAWRVLAGDLWDYARFRAVCLHWNASTARPRGRGLGDPRFHPRRWMMLPEGHGLYPGHPDLLGYIRLVNLSTGAFVRVHLPLLDDHVILDSVDGLLLLHRDHDTCVRLLNPFTGDIAELPPLDSLLPQMEPRRYYSEDSKRSTFRRVCTAVTVSATGAITVMLALDLLHRVAYATTGDQRWTLSTWKLQPLLRPVSFQGKFYSIQFSFQGVNKVLHIYQIDPPRAHTAEGLSHYHQPVPEKIAEFPHDKIASPVFLVECGSELLLVGYSDVSCTQLVVYRLADLIHGRFEPVTSIGDHALFLDERCLCVSPSRGLPSISRDSIICIHSSVRHSEVEPKARLEQYDLGSGIWSPAMDEDCVEAPSPSPCTLIHHLYTCCCRDYWNKGIMFCAEIEPNWPVKSELRFGT